MGYTCTIHTEYVDATITEEVLNNMTRIIEVALTEDKEVRYEESN